MTQHFMPPSSRRTRKKLKTRRKIYHAAIELMTERGYDNVAITEICERADVANATFYLHFPTKASLITPFYDEVYEQVGEQLQSYGGTSIEKLELLRAALANEWSRHGPLLLQILGELATQPKAATALNDAASGIAEMIAGIVREGQANGEMRASLDPGIVASALLAVWNGVMMQLAHGADPDWARLANRQALDIILYGTAADSAPEPARLSATG